MRLLLKSAPAGGYSIDDVRRALKVLQRLDEAGPLRLENDELEFVANVVEGQRWVVALPEVVAFHDKVTGAPELAPGQY